MAHEVPVAQALPRRPERAVDFSPMDRWTPEEVDAHIQYMRDFAAGLEAAASTSTGRRWHLTALRALRRRGPAAGHRRPVRRDEGPHRGLDGHRRGVVGPRGRARRRLSAAPGPDGEPIHEWLEVRPFLTIRPRRANERHAAAGARARGARRPRPSRSRFRGGRGRRTGGAARALATWPDDPPLDPKGWLVTVAWRKLRRRRAVAVGAPRPRGGVHAEPAPGPVPSSRRHAAPATSCARTRR